MLTVGEILKREREKKGLSLVDVEKKIKVRKKFLESIEKNDWTQFASRIYISGVIKNYAKALEINPERALAFFRREYGKKEDVSFKRRVHRGLLTPETRRIVYGTIAGIFLLFVVYFGYQLTMYLSPPSITLLEPTEEVFRRIEKIHIVGKTEKEATITIFGNRIFQDKDGVFSYDFPLKEGKNNFSVDVIGANGKKATLTRQYVLYP